MTPLDILANNREPLLLAEAIGWLHNYKKCCDKFFMRDNCSILPHEIINYLPSDLGTKTLTINHKNENLKDLLNKWKNAAGNNNISHLLQYLSRCHNSSHFDKDFEKIPNDHQPLEEFDYISTPFGFEFKLPNDLTDSLLHLPWANLLTYNTQKRGELRAAIHALFSMTVADNRRPINEVDLWNWGLLVGSLYKASLANVLLSNTYPDNATLKWRLLAIKVNGLDFLFNVSKIPDLLARQELLTNSFDKTKQLLEITYPLGSEIYRDENSSIYVVPDNSTLLFLKDGQGLTLKDNILIQFACGSTNKNNALKMDGEIIPSIKLEDSAWHGQDPAHYTNLYKNLHDYNELPNISSLLDVIKHSKSDISRITKYWDTSVSDTCTACELRPQGPSNKSKERKVCDICEERRADRSKHWTETLDRTIWTDEVADEYGRIALLIGKFDLSRWLDGTFFDSSFLIPPNEPKPKRKSVSFSRLRRIWKTTQIFWENTQEHLSTGSTLKNTSGRLILHPNTIIPNLGDYHAYEIKVKEMTLSVVWVPNKNYFIITGNPLYIAKNTADNTGAYNNQEKAINFIKSYITENKNQISLFNTENNSNNKQICPINISHVEYDITPYSRYIPILIEPTSFAIIIPGNKSFEVIESIKQKYESEFGKVRDRLPIHIGIVFAQRKTPMRAILEAGRSMLSYSSTRQEWTINKINLSNKNSGINNVDNQSNVLIPRNICTKEPHFNKTLTLNLTTSNNSSHSNKHEIQWQVPLKMHDGITDDQWYPYVYLNTNGKNCPDIVNKRRAVLSKNIPDRYLVHAEDLQEGDTIDVLPSTFDFEYLDTNGRRFEIYYGKNGRRARRTRPFYLEDLDRFEMIWKQMTLLNKTQRYQVVQTIESTRQLWYGDDQGCHSLEEPVFRQFVTDTLVNAEWPSGSTREKLKQNHSASLINAGVTGELADLAELHLEILKEQ